MAGSATQRRRLALLALIAASGDRGVSRDRLIGILWPDSEPARGRQVLAQWLHLIRRDLGDEDIVFGTADLRLNPACMTCDVSDLRLALERNDLETAAALYAGPFLDGFYLNGAPEFERWVEEERVRLASRIRGVYETLARTATEAGDLQGAVRWAERLASHDPLSASAALHYMEALANAGDRAGAIRHARVYTSLSRTQLDVDPDPAIAAFARQLRATPVASAPATAHSVGTLPVPEPPSAASAIPIRRTASISRRRLVARVAAFVAIPLLLVALVKSTPTATPSSAPAPSRVMIAPFANEAGDPTLDIVGRLASAWIVRGVGETGLLEVAASTDEHIAAGSALRARAAQAGAGTLIMGRFYRTNDSLAFEAQIIDVARDRVLATLGPVLTPHDRPLDGVESLRRRVMGGVGALVDAGFSPLGAVTAVPPSFEAFRAVSDGHAASIRRRHREAVEHYRRAAALDTSYLYPLVRIAKSYADMFDCARLDSVAAELAPRRPRLSRYEELMLDRELQICRGDALAGYRSGQELVKLAPRSATARQLLARSALVLNRPREIIALLLRTGNVADAARLQLTPLHQLSLSFHWVGEHSQELQVARIAREKFPDLLEPLMFEARAHAALGDLNGARQVVAASLSMASKTSPVATESWTVADVLTTTAHELRVHGQEAEAQMVSKQLLEWLRRRTPEANDGAAEIEYLLARFGAATDVADWSDAEHIAAVLARKFGSHVGSLSARGRLAAYRGRQREAERLSDSLGSLTRMKYPYLRGMNTHARAQIAAILGERETAVQLLRDAFAEGLQYDTYRPSRLRSFNHALPEFQSLRGYEPFDQLVRPQH